MLFDSLGFLAFFPIVVILYYLLPHRFRWALLLAASCYFYMAFIPYYILILLYLIVIDFAAGIMIERTAGRRRKVFLIVSLVANIGTLFFFKYFNFFNANVAHLAALIHWNYSIRALQIALPLGLSFHTFQSLSYVLEVYYGRQPAERNLGTYALFVMFFPQLVAGPIERPQQLLPQLHAEHPFEEQNLTEGLRVMLWGFFKKLVVADTAGVFVDAIYKNLHAANGPTLAVTAVVFAFQLYADFSGYSDIARGSARVFGITLVNNFDAPYFSRSIADFWRRWHISLSNWFRDYFYYPLALAWTKRTKVGLFAALFVTFFVIGLWHGAGWTFVLFGCTFGLYSAMGLMTKKLRARAIDAVGLSRAPRLLAILQTLVTFGLVCIGFVFFRAQSLRDAAYFLGHLANGWGAAASLHFWRTLAYVPIAAGLKNSQFYALPISIIVMLGGEYLQREYRILDRLTAGTALARWSAYYALVAWILAFGYFRQVTFIYFQF
ncbi:MAG TPA: MBOAT family O-acyltransferase [Candidatus Paceibacterota bacterium]|nr:MBOAT family O-acyltransferase [Candidatus Paceibacterota bacterium]